MKKFLGWRIAALTLAALVAGGLLCELVVWAAEAQEVQQENRVLARVDGQEITEADVLGVLQSMGPQGMMMYGSPEGRRAILDELISMRLLALEGAKAKLDQAPEFQAAMERVRAQMLARAEVQELIKTVSVTEEEARKFYDANPERFTQPERVHARHILLSDDVTSADQIAKVQADLKAGVPFDELAKSVSLCPSAPQGGDLGEFQRGQMVPEFEAAAFALKEPGDISEPVKTAFGWHIIKLEGRVPAELVPFENVKAQLLQELEGEKVSELLRAKTEELRKEYKVEILEPAQTDEGKAAPEK